MPLSKILDIGGEAAKTVYMMIKRDADGFALDDADGDFRLAPASPYLSTIEDATRKGFYRLTESRTTWADGGYSVVSYEQAAGAPAPATDKVTGILSFFIFTDSIHLDLSLDVSLSSLATSAEIAALNDFDPATETVDVDSINGTPVTGPDDLKADVSGLSTFDPLTDDVNITAEAVQAMWDALTSALDTAGSIGKLIVDFLQPVVSSTPSIVKPTVQRLSGAGEVIESAEDGERISIRRGDITTLKLVAGPNWNFTGKTLFACMKSDLSQSNAEAKVNRAATITDAANGDATFAFTVIESDTVERYFFEFEQRAGDGLTEPLTVIQIEISITDDVRQ